MFKHKKKIIFMLFVLICIIISISIVNANNNIKNDYSFEQSYDDLLIFDNQNHSIKNSDKELDNYSYDDLNQKIYIVGPTEPIYAVLNYNKSVDANKSINDKNSNYKEVDNKNKKVYPTLIAKNKVFHEKIKNKKYSVILKTNKNKVIKNKLITLKINGKILKAKTNNNGKATFKIKINKKGIYKTTIKFNGNKKFKSVTKNIKIKIK